MFLPIGDTPNPERFTPYVNWALVAANVVVFVLITLPLSAQGVDPKDPAALEILDRIQRSLPPGTPSGAALAHISAYDLFVLRWGFVPAHPSVSTLFASMFLHGGVAHLAGNMLFLWIFGDNIEHRLGRIVYLAVYLATGVLATLTFAAFARDSSVPLVGASGAISGVLGLYFVFFPRNRVKLLIAFFPFYVDVVLVGARWVLGFYLLFDNLLPFLIQAKTSVAHGAHIGGFVAGAAIAVLSERLGGHRLRDRYWRLGLPKKRADAVEPSSAAEIHASISSGKLEDALGRALNLSDRSLARVALSDVEALAGFLMAQGHSASATTFLRRALSTHRGSPPRDLARIYLLLGLIRLEQGQATSAYQHFLTVLDLDPDPVTRRDAEHALNAIKIYQRRGS